MASDATRLAPGVAAEMSAPVVSVSALYLPRTYRHLKEVSAILADQTRLLLPEVGEAIVRRKGEDSGSVLFQLDLGAEGHYEGEYYFVGLLILSGPVNPSRETGDVCRSLYLRLSQKWKAVRTQLSEGTLEFGCFSSRAGGKDLRAGEMFLECAADFLENLAGRHRYSYPFPQEGTPSSLFERLTKACVS